MQLIEMKPAVNWGRMDIFLEKAEEINKAMQGSGKTEPGGLSPAAAFLLSAAMALIEYEEG